MRALFVCVALLAAVAGTIAPASAGDRALVAQFHRGVSLHFWFTWSNHTPGADPYSQTAGALSDGEMAQLHAMGLDFVRLTVDPGVLLDAQDVARQHLMDEIGDAIRRLNGAGLAVIWDYHVSGSYQNWPETRILRVKGTGVQQFRELVGQTAASLAKFDPRKVAFELINEPDFGCKSDSERAELDSLEVPLYHIARERAPGLTLILSPACFDDVDSIMRMDPSLYAHDPNVYYSVHFYEPYLFTAQGELGRPADVYNMGLVPYPASRRSMTDVIAQLQANLAKSDASVADRSLALTAGTAELLRYYVEQPNPNTIRSRFDQITAWRKRVGLSAERVLVGEFDAEPLLGGRGAAPEDRQQWVSDVRSSSERAGFPWCFWAYYSPGGGMALSPSGSDKIRHLDPSIVGALGLKMPQ